jgi:hypothetical protein
VQSPDLVRMMVLGERRREGMCKAQSNKNGGFRREEERGCAEPRVIRLVALAERRRGCAVPRVVRLVALGERRRGCAKPRFSTNDGFRREEERRDVQGLEHQEL